MATINETINDAGRRAAGRPVAEPEPVDPRGKGDGGATGDPLENGKVVARRMNDLIRQTSSTSG